MVDCNGGGGAASWNSVTSKPRTEFQSKMMVSRSVEIRRPDAPGRLKVTSTAVFNSFSNPDFAFLRAAVHMLVSCCLHASSTIRWRRLLSTSSSPSASNSHFRIQFLNFHISFMLSTFDNQICNACKNSVHDFWNQSCSLFMSVEGRTVEEVEERST